MLKVYEVGPLSLGLKSYPGYRNVNVPAEFFMERGKPHMKFVTGEARVPVVFWCEGTSIIGSNAKPMPYGGEWKAKLNKEP